MSKTRYTNEKVKRRYFDYSSGALGYSDKTIKAMELAMWKYDEFTKYEDYKKFNDIIAKQFKKWLSTNKNKRTGKILSLTTQYHTIRHVQDFFKWLSMQAGFKSRIKHDHIAYLRLSKADARIATSSKLPEYPTLAQVKKLCSFPIESEIDKRDKALIAFTALSGMRDNAIISLPIGCFDKINLRVEQNPAKGVQTKFSKLIYTTLFQFDKTILKHFLDWYSYLINEKLYNISKPIFPSTNIDMKSETQHIFTATGITDKFWSNTDSMRMIFKKRAKQQSLEYYSPHKFRHFIINEASKHTKGAEQMKAVSQNMGHENISTTFYGYGAVNTARVGDIITDMDFTE